MDFNEYVFTVGVYNTGHQLSNTTILANAAKYEDGWVILLKYDKDTQAEEELARYSQVNVAYVVSKLVAKEE